MLIIGIDPGLDGALAVVRGPELLAVHDLPAEPTGGGGTVKRRLAAGALAALLRDVLRDYDRNEAMLVIEYVSAGRGQGVASSFSFGDTAGAIRGVAQTLGLRIEYVTPAQWKRAMRVPADKSTVRTVASARWPEHAGLFARVKDHNRAESALIAAYGWEKWG